MMVDNSAKTAGNTNQDAPRNGETGDSPSAPSAVVRHLGLIKAMSIIMAVLIVAALVIIVMTIYVRLTPANVVNHASEIELVLPADTRIISASDAGRGDMLIVLESNDGQMVWRVRNTGRVTHKMRVIAR